MKNTGVLLLLRLKLKQTVNLEDEFNKLQTSDTIKCLKYKNNHKCNMEKASSIHNNNFLYSKIDLISIRFIFENQVILIKYKPQEVIIEYSCLKKNIKIDERVKFIVEKLSLGDHEEPERISYSETWVYNSEKYNHDLIHQKILSHCTSNNLGYNVTVMNSNKIQMNNYKINIGSSIIRIMRGRITVRFQKNMGRLNDFKNLIKQVYGEDIVTKSPFKTIKKPVEKKEELPDEDLRIMITI